MPAVAKASTRDSQTTVASSLAFAVAAEVRSVRPARRHARRNTQGMSEPALLSTHHAALARLFTTDYRAEAERLSGMPSDRHNGTRRMSVLLGLRGITDRRALLQELDDTIWGGAISELRRIAREEGFVACHAHQFADGGIGGNDAEQHEILWHPDGVLLTADTWGGAHTNQATLWFNLEVAEDAMDRPGLPHSDGRVVETNGAHLWIGHAGADEGLRFQMASLRALGELQWPWVARPAGFHLLDRVEADAAENPTAGTPSADFICEARAGTCDILRSAWAERA